MAKLRLITETTYDANPDFYGTTDAAEMAKIDAGIFGDDPAAAFDTMAANDFTIRVEPVVEHD